ncbi:MAG: NYN domain-containing protein [Gammaproteobacteria bacterium]|nr:NYN domain-containing protein [Gammaproteobacteria bacterium]
MKSENKLAVLIDADNVSASLCEVLIQEIANYGIASVKRAYGDWTTTRLVSWKDILHEYAIAPMQQFSYTTGKNSTDSAMIIDAMDLLYTGNFDGFCLVTSDSDFTRLATRLRGSGRTVYGFGEKKTPGALQAACDKFVFLEALKSAAEEQSSNTGNGAPSVKKRSKQQLKQDTKLVSLLRGAVAATSDDDGWANIAAVGTHITNQSSFDPRNYGYQKLSKLIEATELFEMKKTDFREGGSYAIHIRDKRTADRS